MNGDEPVEPAADPEGVVLATVVRPANVQLPQHVPLPPRWAEALAALALVVLADVTVYRGEGFAGFAALFAGGAMLLGLGANRPRLGADFWFIGTLLVVLAARVLWQGSWPLVGIGFALLLAFAMVLSGLRPYVLSVAVFVSQVIRGGFDGLVFYARWLAGRRPDRTFPRWVNVALPVVVVVIFAAIFTAANPDVLTLVSKTAQQWAQSVQDWLKNFSLFEMVFWFLVLWLSAGMLRPSPDGVAAGEADRTAASRGPSEPAPLYAAFRNTLWGVIGLFAIYLAFEFRTLWFREFPDGFYYAGYAHEGAAWLTLALALATAILSLIFSGRTLCDPRLATLRRLAWVWSLLNFLLALAVYHRLLIYIGFNGLTRLRIVGLLGMTAVVIGFLLVLWKITRDRGFTWLVRRQLWTVALMVYLYAIMPIDALVVRYNVARIMAGDPKPAVQLDVQPMSAEGVLYLSPLLECPDPIIREGAHALLAAEDAKNQEIMRRREQRGWTAYQISNAVLADKLSALRPAWASYEERSKRTEALERFKKYVYQWF